MEGSRGSSMAKVSSLALKKDNDLIKECQEIASGIKSGKFKLLSFIEELGGFLTDKNVDERAYGTLALSTMLKYLPKDCLNETELNYLTAFYCDRMKDKFEVIPAVLHGILAIVQMSRLPQDTPLRLLGPMFQHIHCQSQLQPNRKIIYTIFKTLLETRPDDLRSMGPDFTYGLISSIDGERDPRNLMLIFSFLPNFIKGFPLGHLTEEMFEVIACYFPVDFNSSASEAQSVTREDLAYSLAPCLYASQDFAEYCIPLIIERLDSSLKLAKLDSLHLLREGASTYGPSGLQPHLEELWPVLRKEVFPGGDPELRNSGLETVTELVKVLSLDPKKREIVVEKIITDTKSSLCDVQLSLFWPAEKLLEAVAKAGKDACTQVLKAFVPLCLGQYSTKTSFSDRVTLTESLNNFMAICEEQGFTVQSVPELAWTDIPVLYLNALITENMELRLKTFAGLTILKSSLNETCRKMLYRFICQSVDEGNDNELKNTCHSCLLNLAKIYPDEIMDNVMKNLTIDDPYVDSTVFTHRLQALCAIAKIPELGRVILPNVVSVGRSDIPEKSIAALYCLRKLVASRSDLFNIQNFLYRDCKVIDLLISTNANDSIKKLTLVASVCRSIVRKLDINDQQIIVDKYASLLGENLSENNVVLLEGIITPLQKTVRIENSVNLFKNLLHLAFNGSNSNSKLVSCKLISLLINKLNEDENLKSILNMLRERINFILENTESDKMLKESSILLNTWLTKALIVRGSQKSQDFLDFHMNLLKNAQVGELVANGFKTLSDRFEDTLTEENFCNVKLFYKQRVFQNIVQKNSDFDFHSRQNYLIALTHLVEEVPMELLLMHLTQLVPLLMESIALDNSQLILSSLITLKLLLDTKHKIFSEQVQHFIPKFLSLTTHKEMKVRRTALECLLHYANYPTVLILPFKIDVQEKLAAAIDDRKRLVRTVAVKTRTRWYLVGSPGEPKQP